MAVDIKPPGPGTVGEPGNDPVLKDEPLRMAAFGDSLMWGQGLSRNATFASLIASELAGIHDKTVEMTANRARSGAQITDRGSEREDFLDTYPALFSNRPQRDRFRTGVDEGRASELYGEIPATFPTIRWQVQAVAPATGADIGVVLLNGGADDIGFDEVINPGEFPGEFIEQFDGQIRTICHDDILSLLRDVRARCPNAIILVFGYFSPLSYESKDSKIEAFFKHEADDAFGWWLNGILGFVDVDRSILEAKVRSVWAQGRSHHWMRLAVADANAEEALRGPGILFVPSGMGPENAVFADSPMVHEDFTHPTTDPAATERARRCPRVEHLKALQQALFSVQPAGVGIPFLPEPMRKLRDALSSEGPESLVRALTTVIDSFGGRGRDDAFHAIRKEVGRIQRALIASFIHPNAAGARQYARIAMVRYRRHLVLTGDIPAQSGPGGREAHLALVVADATLRRYKLRGRGPLLADVHHLDVDALSLRVVTKRESDEKLTPDISLTVETRSSSGKAGARQFRLNFPYRITKVPPVLGAGFPTVVVKKFYPHFEPSATNRFTLDTGGDLRLGEITGFKLDMAKDPLAGEKLNGAHGSVWRPLRIELQINGTPVIDMTFQDTELKPGGTLRIPYPPPA